MVSCFACCVRKGKVRNAMKHKKYELSHGIYTENELWEVISTLSDIRAGYNLFNAEEYPKHHACSVAIDALRVVMGVREDE